MKKMLRKVVTMVTATALAFTGSITFNPAQAKADDAAKTVLHITAPEGASTIAAWVDPSIGLSLSSQVNDSAPALDWGGNNNNPQFVDKGDTYYDVTIDGSITAKDTTAIQLLVDCGKDSQYCCKYIIKADDSDGNVALFNDNSDLWVTLSGTVGSWEGVVSMSKVDPAAITAADVEKAITAIGDVTLDSKTAIEAAETAVANYLKVDSSYKTDDISNYATLTAARAKYDELKAAADKAQADADAAAAGELTVYFHDTEGWGAASLWAWTSAGNLFSVDWPGQAMTACENNDGWYKMTIKTNGLTSIIFNNGESSDTIQTVDIVDVAAGTYWYSLGEADADGKFTTAAKTEEPTGWVEEEKTVVDTVDPEEDPEEDPTDDTDDVEDEDDTEDAASAWDSAKLKIHVLMPEGIDNWENLGIYVFGSDENAGWTGAELAGAWPGTEMSLENGSETWYAFAGNFSDGFYNVIINNFVSDDEAAAGATKLQAEALNLTDGEYWITIALDEETGKYIATSVTEAPEDYDGEGLGDDAVAEGGDDAEDGDDAADDADGDDAAEDPASGSTDGMPVAAAMVIALLAGTAVVVSRKRKVA